MPTLLVAHLQFTQSNPQSQNCKRATKQTHHDRQMNGQATHRQEGRTANKVLPQWGLTCFYETFVHRQTEVHLLNISAKNPPLRQYPNR